MIPSALCVAATAAFLALFAQSSLAAPSPVLGRRGTLASLTHERSPNPPRASSPIPLARSSTFIGQSSSSGNHSPPPASLASLSSSSSFGSSHGSPPSASPPQVALAPRRSEISPGRAGHQDPTPAPDKKDKVHLRSYKSTLRHFGRAVPGERAAVQGAASGTEKENYKLTQSGEEWNQKVAAKRARHGKLVTFTSRDDQGKKTAAGPSGPEQPLPKQHSEERQQEIMAGLQQHGGWQLSNEREADFKNIKEKFTLPW